ncbi:MAG: glycosyltransferase [Bacillales bacterium]|nr:glycosyltransferase [Bacillales bacterium]
MKVLFVTSNISFRSGVASVLMNYIRNINKNIFSISILYYDLVDSPSYEKELLSLGVKLYHVSRRRFISNLKKFCHEHFGEFDIIHVNDPYLAFCFIGIKKSLGVKKVIFHTHSTKFSDTKIKGVRNALLSIPARYISDELFACSKIAGKKTFGKRFSKKGTVIYNAIDLEKYSFNIDERLKIRAELNVNGLEIIGHVGNMTPPKNHFFIIDIFEKYHNAHPNSILLLIGDGYLRQEIMHKIENKGLKECVIFTGVVPNVYSYMNAMDKFIFPSLFEGLGIVMVEAQTNGLNCLFADTVPVEANLSSCSNIKLSLKNNADNWADKLNELESRKNESVLCDLYDIKKASLRLEEIYEDILDEK